MSVVLVSCLQFQLMKEKESFEIRKRLLWEMKLIDWPKCSVLNKLTLLTYQYETKQEDG